MNRLTLALISGGASSERPVSLESGEQVAIALDNERYRILRYDPMTDLGNLVADAPQIDAALIILHGPMGEDGTVQGMLDLLEIPYQGAGVLGSALAMNKHASKQLYEKAGLPVAPYRIVTRDDSGSAETYADRLGLPLVVKPVAGGSSIGMSIVRSPAAILPALETAFAQDRVVMLESHIAGRELTCAVVGNEALDAYPVVEIIPGEGHEFFDYEAKYLPGASREICPADISDAVSDQVKAMAKTAHTALFCRGYSRTDFIFTGGGLYVIETNTIPGMTRTSLLPQSARAAGVSFSGLLDKLIFLSLEDHTKKAQIRDRNRLGRIRAAMAGFILL